MKLASFLAVVSAVVASLPRPGQAVSPRELAAAAAPPALRAGAADYGGRGALLQGAAGAPWVPQTEGVEEIGFRAEAEAHEGLNQAHVAEAAKQESTHIAGKNRAILSALQGAVEESVAAARGALAGQKLAETIAANAQQAAHDRAFDAIDAKVNEIRDAALEKAHEEATVRGQKLMEKMLAAAPEAAAKAAAPYAAAQAKAAEIADQYQAMGDAKVGKSMSTQADAQAELGSAQSWQSLGELGKAQGLLRDSHKKMEKAVGLNAQASAFYSAAESILSHEDEYKAEADMAEYHAMIMHDPDAEPPGEGFPR